MKRRSSRVQKSSGPSARGPRQFLSNGAAGSLAASWPTPRGACRGSLSPARGLPPVRAGDTLETVAARRPETRRKALARLTGLSAALVLAMLPATDLRAVEAPDAGDAGAFLAELNRRAIAQLARADVAQAERERRFRALFDEGFAAAAIGRFVLGRYWRTASTEDRAAFLETFREVIARRFSPLLAEPSGMALSIGQVRPDPGNPNIVTVTSRVQRAEGAPVNIEWRLRKRHGRYRIFDVVAEGVSVAITLRSEYASYVARHGGDVGALVVSLRRQLAANDDSPETSNPGARR